MSGTLAIVVFFAGLLFIILIHEGGHYLVARGFGFKVEEYFVGFGPRIWSTRRDIAAPAHRKPGINGSSGRSIAAGSLTRVGRSRASHSSKPWRATAPTIRTRRSTR